MNPLFTEEWSEENKLVKRGNLRPARVRTMPNDVVSLLVDSKDRISGTDYNFVASLKSALLAPLNISIAKASIPKIPNINRVNNVLVFINIYGSFTCTLTPGFYNQVSLVNAIENGMNTAINGSDYYSVVYNTLNKTISITSNNGLVWFFSDQCSFIQYGMNVVNFKGYPPSSDSAATGSLTQYSGPCGLIYSRYVAIRSNNLLKYAFETPRSTFGIINNIATISLVNAFDESDFSINNVYEGNLLLELTADTSCVLNTAQSGNALTNIDFQMVDEYGFDLAYSLTLGSPYNYSQLGCIIWLIVNV